MNYVDLMQKPGKRIFPKVYYFNGIEKITIQESDIISVKPSFKAKLTGTVMKGLELELKKELPNKPIYFENTVKYNNDLATKTIGPYYLQEKPTYNADDSTYSHTLYDDFINAMVDYVPIKITYPTTVIEFFKQLCKECGFTTDITELPNGSRIIQSDIYEGINYTYRDVYDDIGVATGTLFGCNGKKIIKCSFGTNEILIDDHLLKNQNIEVSEHFGPINSIILLRSGESDGIYKRDETLTTWNEFVIKDNQLMNENDRSDYLPELYDALYGIEFDTFDFELIGYGGFEVLDKIKITTRDKVYNSFVFNNEEEFTDGYSECIYADLPEETEPDYKNYDTTDQRINKTYIIVRKVEQEIQALVSKTIDLVENIHETGKVEMKSTFDTTEFVLRIRNACQYFKSKWLFKSKTKFLKGSWLRVTYEDKTYERYKLPPLSLRQLNGIYDEMIIQSGKISVIKRVGIDENNTLYLLPQEKVITYDDILIQLKNGTNTIQLESFPEAVFDMTYMTDNLYTNTFATSAEVQALLEITVGRIMLEVSSKTSEEEVKSLINISLNDIKLELTKKIGEERVNTLIEAAINQYKLIVSKEIEDSSDALSEDLNKKINDNSEDIKSLDTSLSGKIDETKANELIDNKTKNFIDETKANKLIENKTSPLGESINKVDTKYKESVDNINKEMGTKIGQDDYTAAIIIGKINDDESELLISADKVNLVATDILNILSGNTINMTAKNMSFESTNWSIDDSGKMYLKDEVTDIGNEEIDANLTIESTVYPNIAKFTSNGIRMIHNDDGDGEKTDSYLGSHSLFMFYEKGNVFNYLIQDICLQTTVEENNNITQKYIPVITLMEDESSLNQHNTMITSRGITTNGKISATDIFAENLDVTGSKHRIVKIDNNEYIALNAYETATPYFGDIGSGITDENGYCRIEIENIFSQTIEIDTYKVFLQELGEGNLYVKKYDRYFEAFGTPNLEFDYEIKAIQKGYKGVRLEKWKSNIKENQELKNIYNNIKKEENRL